MLLGRIFRTYIYLLKEDQDTHFVILFCDVCSQSWTLIKSKWNQLRVKLNLRSIITGFRERLWGKSLGRSRLYLGCHHPIILCTTGSVCPHSLRSHCEGRTLGTSIFLLSLFSICRLHTSKTKRVQNNIQI